MNSAEKRHHKNNLRRQQRDEIRQALLINDYIKLKYSEVYEDAAKFYNYLNNFYPCKKDLRRTDEFKALKMGFTFVGKKRYPKLFEANLPADPYGDPKHFHTRRRADRTNASPR